MMPAHHFTDVGNLRMALIARTVEDPLPQWDPDSGAWMVRARHRNGGEEWVLARGEGPAVFSDGRAAWAAANWLRVAAAPYLLGRR